MHKQNLHYISCIKRIKTKLTKINFPLKENRNLAIIARTNKEKANQTRVYFTRSRARMAGQLEQPGRNLSQEVDEVREKVGEMIVTQTRMEETLQTIRETIALLTTRVIGGERGRIPNQAEGPHNVALDMPIGMGYETMGPAGSEHQYPGDRGGGPFHVESGEGERHAPTQRDMAKQSWMDKMEEKIKAIQGSGTFGSLGVDELCPTADIVIPRDFKVPDFTKYDGSTSPLLHLRTYCTKMSIWSKDEKFLISFFHESLTGPALEWYIQMNHSAIDCWRDLADAFMNQYRFNIDMAPTREQLGILQKKNEETFKQYAQRWRTLAAQVQPPLTISEMCSYFLGTLGSPYVAAMAGAAYRDFADLISAGERIEMLTRAGKLQVEQSEGGQSKKGYPQKKKDPEVGFIRASPNITPQQPHYNQPRPNTPYTMNPNTNPSPMQSFPINNIPVTYPQPRPNYQQPRPTYRQTQANFPPFPKLSITNTELFQRLSEARLIAGIPVKDWEPPFPAWYNPNLTCKYHMGAAGHSIEDCEAFKTAVRRLIAHGKLDIQEEAGPNINSNPLHNHDGSRAVSMVEGDQKPIKKVLKLKTPMIEIWEGLHRAGYEVSAPTREFVRYAMYDEKRTCVYHHDCAGHDIEDCWDFKARIQSLMSLGVVQARGSTFEEEIDVLERFVLKVPPLNQPAASGKVVVTVKKPAPFVCKNTHAIPWNYETRVEVVGGPKSEVSKKEKVAECVGNIVSVSGITRSGRYFGPEESERKKKEKEAEREEQSEEEFLKIMKQSEYDVTEQLKKTPARISLLSLILTSEVHRKALLRTLEEAFVKPDVAPQTMVNMVDPMQRVNLITFSESEVHPHARGECRALHITLKCREFVIAKVLIDGGSALNVLPMTTLTALGLGERDLTPQTLMVRAFDGSKRSVLGEVVLPLDIGPSIFRVLFQVMVVDSAYTMLLGRPWIHEAGAVPSTLHQRVKFVENRNIITIRGEEEMLVSKPLSLPYVDNTEEEVTNMCHSFEMDRPMTAEGASLKCDVNQVVARIMTGNGYKEGKGLGRHLQGICTPIPVKQKSDTAGIGYEGHLEMKSKKSAVGSQLIPHLSDTFPTPAEVLTPEDTVHIMHRLEINMADKDDSGNRGAILPSTNQESLSNWEAEPVIDVATFM